MTTSGTHDTDTAYMRACLRLAAKGRGRVSPNPMVGAVIVRNGRIIGKGYHREFGGAHAEVHAVADAHRHGESVEGATIYVSLEPCFHVGKTPPCVDLLIRENVARVVTAVKDPNPLVNGKSIGKLRRAGIVCETGVCRAEARRLNEPFFSWFKTGRPYIALKTAETADGFIARTDGSSKWITNAASRKHVHALRASYDAILIGAGTAIADDPLLTVRNVKGANPLRVVLDGRLRLPLDAALVTTAHEVATIVYTARTRDTATCEKIARLEALGVVVIPLKAGRGGRMQIGDVLADLAEQKIMSVLVEGGAHIYREFLNARTADILYRFSSPQRFGEGLPGISRTGAPAGLHRRAHLRFGRDTMDEYTLSYD